MKMAHSNSLSVSPSLSVKRAGGGWGARSGSHSPLWLELMAPTRCVLCGQIGNPLCACCRDDLAPRWRRRGSVWYLGEYAGRWPDLVGAWKFGGRWDAPRPLIEAAGAPPLCCPGVVLIPASQSRWRFATRGYNQAALLADWLAASSGGIVIPLLRDPWRRGQTHLASSGAARRVGQMTVNPALVRRVPNQSVVLVDDVMTTGRTLREMRRTVESAGLTVRGEIVLTRSFLRRGDAF